MATAISLDGPTLGASQPKTGCRCSAKPNPKTGRRIKLCPSDKSRSGWTIAGPCTGNDPNR